MKKQDQLQLVCMIRPIAIMRANSSVSLNSAAEALRAGGVRSIEVTVTIPGALTAISEPAASFGEAVQFCAGGYIRAGILN